MGTKNINKLKSELNKIRLCKDLLDDYTLFEYSNRNPNKEDYYNLINNAISDLYLLTDEFKLNVLKDFWIEEGRFFEYYDIARRCRNYAMENETQNDFYNSFISLFNGFFKPKIEVNSKNLDSHFLLDLPALLLEKKSAIHRFIYEVKTKYFPNTFIDFLSVAKTSESIGHMINEIEGIKKLRNQFVISQDQKHEAKAKKERAKKEEPDKLVDVFESVSKYKFIMDLLVTNVYCQPGSYIWIDENKANKGTLVVLLKNLHAQGYYKENRRLSNDQIKKIALNTFGADISIDTVKSTKANNLVLKFIPLASTVK